MVGECLEVLADGREVELVPCTGEAAQTHSLETVMGFQAGKAHLDPFAKPFGITAPPARAQGIRA
jgi:hypothetical protein